MMVKEVRAKAILSTSKVFEYVVNPYTGCPAALLAGKSVCRLEFHVENPQSAARAAKALGQQVIGDDPRMLGFKVQRLAFHSRERLRYEPGETLEFTARGDGRACTPTNAGACPTIWACGPSGAHSTLTLLPAQPMECRAQAIFTINDAAVSEQHPTQTGARAAGRPAGGQLDAGAGARRGRAPRAAARRRVERARARDHRLRNRRRRARPFSSAGPPGTPARWDSAWRDCASLRPGA